MRTVLHCDAPKVVASSTTPRCVPSPRTTATNQSLRRPYRAETRGEVEWPDRYVREDFFLAAASATSGSQPAVQGRLDQVANPRTHATTRRVVAEHLPGTATSPGAPRWTVPGGAATRAAHHPRRDDLAARQSLQRAQCDPPQILVEVHSTASEVPHSRGRTIPPPFTRCWKAVAAAASPPDIAACHRRPTATRPATAPHLHAPGRPSRRVRSHSTTPSPNDGHPPPTATKADPLPTAPINSPRSRRPAHAPRSSRSSITPCSASSAASSAPSRRSKRSAGRGADHPRRPGGSRAALQMARRRRSRRGRFDFSFQPSGRPQSHHRPCRTGLHRRHEVVHLVGQPGTGKSDLAIAFGVEAVRAGRSVYFSTARRHR